MNFNPTIDYPRPVELIRNMNCKTLALVEAVLMDNLRYVALNLNDYATENALTLFSELWSLVEYEYERRNEKSTEV